MTLHPSPKEVAAKARRSSVAIRSLTAASVGFALLAGLSAAAHATENFSFSYSGGGVSGHGVLTAEEVAPGTWLALSGNDTTIGGPLTGTLALATNPSPPGESYSPSGYFIFDNLIYPGSDPIIDNGGLLFVNGSGGEINLFSYGPDNYTHYDNTGFNVPITFAVTAISGSDATAAPEPASLATLGAGVLGLALVRRKRHSR